MIHPFFRHALHCRLLIWLLAFALPLQAATCASQAVRGTAHVHRQVTGALALEDFRRVPLQTPFLDRRMALDHVHAFGLVQRHAHARFDASVVKTEAAAASETEERATPVSPAAAFVAMLSAVPSWHAGPGVSFAATSRDARFSSCHPAPPEKPPSATA